MSDRKKIGGHPYSRRSNQRQCHGKNCQTIGKLAKIRTSEGVLLFFCDPCRSDYVARRNLEANKEQSNGES